MLAAALLIGYPKDDGSNKNCGSCQLQGKKLEICKNENGTYTLTHDGKSETIKESQLEGFTPKEFVEILCAAEQLVF